MTLDQPAREFETRRPQPLTLCWPVFRPVSFSPHPSLDSRAFRV